MTVVDYYPLHLPEVSDHQAVVVRFATGTYNTRCTCGHRSPWYRSPARAENAHVTHAEEIVMSTLPPATREAANLAYDAAHLARFLERLNGGDVTCTDGELVHDGVGGAVLHLYLEDSDLDEHNMDEAMYNVFADSMDHRWYLACIHDDMTERDVLLPEGDVSRTLTVIATEVLGR